MYNRRGESARARRAPVLCGVRGIQAWSNQEPAEALWALVLVPARVGRRASLGPCNVCGDPEKGVGAQRWICVYDSSACTQRSCWGTGMHGACRRQKLRKPDVAWPRSDVRASGSEMGPDRAARDTDPGERTVPRSLCDSPKRQLRRLGPTHLPQWPRRAFSCPHVASTRRRCRRRRRRRRRSARLRRPAIYALRPSPTPAAPSSSQTTAPSSQFHVQKRMPSPPRCSSLRPPASPTTPATPRMTPTRAAPSRRPPPPPLQPPPPRAPLPPASTPRSPPLAPPRHRRRRPPYKGRRPPPIIPPSRPITPRSIHMAQAPVAQPPAAIQKVLGFVFRLFLPFTHPHALDRHHRPHRHWTYRSRAQVPFPFHRRDPHSRYHQPLPHILPRIA